MVRSGPFAMRLKPTHSTFEALLESIVYQQLHGRAAKAIHGRILELFPDHTPTSAGMLRLSDVALRGAGLSASKLLAIRDLAEKSEAGVVPPLTKLHRMADEEICARLTTVRGIGVWTVQMLLIFRMGRPNVLPVSDYGVRKGFRSDLRQATSGRSGHPRRFACAGCDASPGSTLGAVAFRGQLVFVARL